MQQTKPENLIILNNAITTKFEGTQPPPPGYIFNSFY